MQPDASERVDPVLTERIVVNAIREGSNVTYTQFHSCHEVPVRTTGCVLHSLSYSLTFANTGANVAHRLALGQPCVAACDDVEHHGHLSGVVPREGHMPLPSNLNPGKCSWPVTTVRCRNPRTLWSPRTCVSGERPIDRVPETTWPSVAPGPCARGRSSARPCASGTHGSLGSAGLCPPLRPPLGPVLLANHHRSAPATMFDPVAPGLVPGVGATPEAGVGGQSPAFVPGGTIWP
jgi:hypothetical protein